MNILFVHERLGFGSGIEQNMFDTGKALRARGHKCYLSVREGTGHDEKLFREAFDGVEVGWNGPSPTAVEIGTMLRRLNCDTLYVHKVADTSFAANEAAWTVRMVHDHDVTCPRKQKFFAWNGHVCQKPIGWQCYADLGFLEKKADSYVINSINGAKIEAARQNSFDRVLTNSRWMSESLTLNGVDPTRVRIVHPVEPDLAEEITPVPNNQNLLYVGRLIQGKGVDLLFRALTGIEGPWRLTIAGDGDMRPSLEKLAQRLGIADRVNFLGWVPPRVAHRLYDDARIVCVPCRWPEPFGMVGVEAMRRGRPVVAFDVGGISDWLSQQRTGIMAPEQDLVAYAGAIKFLLEDHEAASQMGERARWAALERFNFKRYIDQLETLLYRTDRR